MSDKLYKIPMTNANGGIDNDQQTLSYDEKSDKLTISNGNTVKLKKNKYSNTSWLNYTTNGEPSEIVFTSFNELQYISFYSTKDNFKIFLNNNYTVEKPSRGQGNVEVPLIHRTTYEIVGHITIDTDGNRHIKVIDKYSEKDQYNGMYNVLDSVLNFNVAYTILDNTPPEDNGNPPTELHYI